MASTNVHPIRRRKDAHTVRLAGVVVDEDDVTAQTTGFAARRRFRPRLLASRRTKSRGEPEARSATGLALDPDAALHEIDDVPRDDESKARALATGVAGVAGLGERLKESALSSAMPRPISPMTSKSSGWASFPPCSRLTTTRTPPTVVNLRAFPIRLMSTCRSLPDRR